MITSSETTNNIINDYISQLDDFEIELSEQEQKDFDELSKLLQNRSEQEDLSSKIWSTIKKATIDSVEQIIGLSDRGDWRPGQGAIITTPLNFREGVVASNADQKRYEMWQDRLSGKACSASDFRKNSTRFSGSYEKAKEKFKDEIRNPDGSYNNGYNNTLVYDQGDPRTYNQPDSSGDMSRDTTKTLNVDHINSVKDLYEDDLMALYGGSTEEGFDETMRKVANNPKNFVASDEHANKSMRDMDTYKTATNRPDLNMDPEKVKKKQTEADKSKNNILFKGAIGEKSKDLAINMTKSTLSSAGKELISTAMKITISETVVEFQSKSDENLIDRIKRVISNVIKQAKQELSHLWYKIKQHAADNAVSEITNLILNYFVSTVKNVFKLIRCLFGSIVQAFKIIFDSSKPWEERLFEALKIISAGIAMATGTMLNELIAKLIATNIPFLAGFAGDISSVISGLISAILSALVLMTFDRYKASLQIKDEERKIQLLQMQLVSCSMSHVQISTNKTKLLISQTTKLVRNELIAIQKNNREIEDYSRQITETIERQKQIHNEINQTQQNINKVQAEHEVTIDSRNLMINDKLNKLPKVDE